MSVNKILFGDNRADVYQYVDIYDPATDGDVNGTSKVIPSIGSLVIKDHHLYEVTAQDPLTYKSTLTAITIDTEVVDEAQLISYGNDVFMLYYDDRVRPTQLNVDGKIVLFGANLTEYQLIRNGDEVISIYLNPDETINGTRIPLTTSPNNNAVKLCTNCHTLSSLQDGELVTLRVFDHLGIECINIRMHAKRAVILNDLSSNCNPIVDFDATCLQMKDGEFYIYEKQSIEALGIAPTVTYADGTTEIIPVDNVQCFIYGFEDFIPSYTGYRRKLLIKYFLSDRQLGTNVVDNGGSRFVYVEKWLTTISNKSLYEIKISVIPVWDSNALRYNLRFLAYTLRRDQVYDVTPYIQMETPYDGKLFGTTQMITYNVNLANILGADHNIYYRQSTWLKLRLPPVRERYVIMDSAHDDRAFGVEAPPTFRRPIIVYDTDLQMYFIPTSNFINVEAFIESFYRLARPLYNANTELREVTPTHFTIRDLSLNVQIAAPIPVEQFSQAWNIISVYGPSNRLLNSTVIVEFLTKSGDDYQILYGVPVEVWASDSGYNN